MCILLLFGKPRYGERVYVDLSALSKEKTRHRKGTRKRRSIKDIYTIAALNNIEKPNMYLIKDTKGNVFPKWIYGRYFQYVF